MHPSAVWLRGDDLASHLSAQLVELTMTQHIQPALNRRFILRYDRPHQVVSEEDSSDWLEIDNLLAGGEHMDVNGIGGVGRTAPLSGARPAAGVESPTSADALAPQDEVQISSEARKLDELSRTQAIRQERIAQIQQEIAAGTYDTPEKMDAALDRFLDKYGLSDE